MKLVNLMPEIFIHHIQNISVYGTLLSSEYRKVLIQAILKRFTRNEKASGSEKKVVESSKYSIGITLNLYLLL
jgi:hypothetical protein